MPPKDSDAINKVDSAVDEANKNEPESLKKMAEGLPPAAPDLAEAEMGLEMDEIVPTCGYQMLPMIGLGGSAGSIPVLRAFFSAMPTDSGMVFVVVLHLSPEHESTLAELLQRSTGMRVIQAVDGEKVEANHVYVIPPAKHLASADGHLRLTELEHTRGSRVAVDLFFRTLADTHGPHSTAIVLSGADGDGAIGIKRIKERGGLTIAQDPDEAEHSSMPRTAIATGMVDWVLPVEEMPARLMQYHTLAQRLKLPKEEGPQPAQAFDKSRESEDEAEKAFRDVLAHLRTRTGRDFSYYKRAAILRRISRRMQVNEVESVPEYLKFLRMHPGESGALLQDLLTSVTNFFRDREAFAAIEAQIPELFANKGPGSAVRVWVAACATGEEAYSMAMLLIEHARTLENPPAIQVFATDLDEDVIHAAREAVYPKAITADVSEERLRQFFVNEHRGFRVRSEVREVVLFALHDLLKDSPFSRLDLISCRNLLIYLDEDAQKRAIETFHFALRPEGRLFLGASEIVENGNPLFSVLDKKHRIYASNAVARTALPLPAGPGTLQRALEAREQLKAGPVIAGETFIRHAAQAESGVSKSGEHQIDPVSWEQSHLKLIERFAPPSLIVNRDYDIVHASENAGRFLQFAGGKPSMNLLHVVNPMLRIELRAALFRAAQTNAAVEVLRVPAEFGGARWAVDISVAPALEIAPDHLLVVFAWRELFKAGEAKVKGSESEPAARHLEHEIEELKSRLRDTVEQCEASNEELKSSNEELQAINEELRSAGEELETGREELQSINEELMTVNQEQKRNVEELARANNDLQNLMAATAIATIFLDRHLYITRYTPFAVPLFNLIPNDLGRPLSDLAHRLDYPELNDDAMRVFETLLPIKREVSDDAGRWFLARLLPYRTVEDYIAGAVLTFVDITESKLADMELRKVKERLQRAIAIETVGVVFFKQEGAITEANNAFLRMSGYAEEDLRNGLLRWDAQTPSEFMPQSQRAAEELATQERTMPYEKQFIRKDGSRWWGLFAAAKVSAEEGVEFVLDVSERKEIEAALAASKEWLCLIIENAREYAIISMSLDRRVTSWNSGAEAILGYAEQEILNKSGDIIFTPEDRAEGMPELEMQTALKEGRAIDERWHQRKDGSRFWGSGVMTAMRDSCGEGVGFVKIFRDQTAELRAKEALEQSGEELWMALQEKERARLEAEAAGRAKDHFLAVLSHELRTPLTPVLLALDTLSRRKDLPKPVVDALAMIDRNVQLESHFIEDLLDVTLISKGKIGIVCVEMDLHQTASRALEVSSADIEKKSQRLITALEAKEDRLIGDSNRLQQAFWNLLKNASKFTPEEGVITIRSRNAEECIIVEISDTGIGIEAEAMAKIFNPFEQASESISRRFGGLGLGLAIAKAAIEAHSGTLSASSAGPGHGATFTVSLPLMVKNKQAG